MPAEIQVALHISRSEFNELVKSAEKEYKAASVEGWHALGDKLATVHQEPLSKDDKKLYSDNLKWLLARMLPQVFGDALHIKHSGTIDLRAAMSEARGRILAPVDVQVIEDKAEQRAPSTDTESVDEAAAAELVRLLG